MGFLNPGGGPVAGLLALGMCVLAFALAPFFALFGAVSGVVTFRSRSIVLGLLIGAASGPLLLAILWVCGAIQITVNNQPVKFTTEMFCWWSLRLWVPGALGALVVGLLVPSMPSGTPAQSRDQRHYEDDEDDDRPRRRRWDDDDDDRPRRRRY